MSLSNKNSCRLLRESRNSFHEHPDRALIKWTPLLETALALEWQRTVGSFEYVTSRKLLKLRQTSEIAGPSWQAKLIYAHERTTDIRHLHQAYLLGSQSWNISPNRRCGCRKANLNIDPIFAGVLRYFSIVLHLKKTQYSKNKILPSRPISIL